MNQDYFYDLKGKRVWVVGHTGMAGSALVRRLARESCELMTVGRRDLDLTRQTQVEDWLAANRPEAIFLAAGRVGGIHANSTMPAEFLYENLMIAANVIRAAHAQDVERLLFLGSSCIYPREAPQPIPESALLTGPLEPTNEWYALAKIAGIKLAQAFRREFGRDYISAMPTNLYGPGDNFEPMNSHVPAALLCRFHEARLANAPEVEIWGTGTPLREFMHVDDMADACVFLMQRYSADDIVNIGSGDELSIADFARKVAEAVGYRGALRFDVSRPDGMPRKLLDPSSLQRMGWCRKIPLGEGLRSYYQWYLDNQDRLRGLSRDTEKKVSK
ncbi:bifunctional GDP-fucose synthetase: GDP-4-dehydro-6-deoxy-D-mannose epimerase and GDP-4-dehydro-6-L-deoxygalactose reductase [uncultured Alphaproteobacteria bacterium]|uniref:GDP-L-fucose synthase n=1 Tax=uncultured Alphaproteobacteria bacterium TaxID=91750 RepID=A0A212KD68_9PROT|nr:bifunctional GDP-fucose synthetase: GDP-4-dehydro-6-deoxy-D-mannose epimerase and GDP-4-dehydro-6-L-deoxygalactose reductase [uncultured Alphaproteobacteria bacterium]